MRLPGNKWNARKYPSHTCKHVLPGSGRSQTARPLTDGALHGNVPRGWRKIHLGIDEQTLEVRAVEITGSHIGDAPVLPDLLSQIPADEEIASVTVDGAYDTRKCHDAIADRGSNAVIRPRKNAKPWKTVTAGAVARNEALRASKYLGRAIWRNWSGYNRRSRVETNPLGIMRCITLPGSGCTV
jgi:hypothetical protein